MKKLAKSKVLDLVSERLKQVRLGDIKLDVINGNIERKDDCWRIPVQASAPPSSTVQYLEALVDVELELNEKHDIDVWLIPVGAA